MAYPPIQNRINGHAWFRATANATIQLSDLVANNSLEGNASAMSITQIFWTGPWSIARGANVVFQSNGDFNGHWDLAASGVALREYNGANIVLTTASATATILLQVNKETYANGAVGGQY